MDNVLAKLMSVNETTYKAKLRNEMQLAGKFDAEGMYNYIADQIKDYQKDLSDNEEIGLKLANFGEASEIHIRTISYKNPNIIEFSGKNLNGDNCKLIQHISQLNFLIISLKPVEEKPYRIGFSVDS